MEIKPTYNVSNPSKIQRIVLSILFGIGVVLLLIEFSGLIEMKSIVNYLAIFFITISIVGFIGSRLMLHPHNQICYLKFDDGERILYLRITSFWSKTQELEVSYPDLSVEVRHVPRSALRDSRTIWDFMVSGEKIGNINTKAYIWQGEYRLFKQLSDKLHRFKAMPEQVSV